ncbi:hypothetical protein FQV37_1436 [Psychrobacter nivimaris]|uniref:Uncharacterized protein n=1 Tax=Psychrobacter nivimaris TaxID=281738 RepID=A0A6N7BZZ1_9GAMM|nr:hypothetical protein FQV37_1436 [Psychrobacter nivimaris]
MTGNSESSILLSDQIYRFATFKLDIGWLEICQMLTTSLVRL